MSIKWSAQPKKCRKETKKNREPPTVCWLGASLSLLQIYFLAKISWKGKSHNPMASPNRDTLGIAQTSSARQSLICRRVGCGPTEITHTHTHTMGAVKQKGISKNIITACTLYLDKKIKKKGPCIYNTMSPSPKDLFYFSFFFKCTAVGVNKKKKKKSFCVCGGFLFCCVSSMSSSFFLFFLLINADSPSAVDR